MRPRGLLLRIPPALSRGVLRTAVAALAIVLLAPMSASGASALPDGDRDLAGPMPAAPAPPPGVTRLVSTRFGGGFPGGASIDPSISASGRYVAFTSGAADLVAGDLNRSVDVFVRDRTKGTTTRAPGLNGLPVPAGGAASQPSISADGTVVAFDYRPPSQAAVLGTIVLAWDRTTGTVEVVSRTTRNSNAFGSREPSVSEDGRYVAYTSDSSAIVPPDGNGASDVFRFDRRTGRTVLVSIGAAGGTPAGPSTSPSISADGNLVAFVSSGGDTLTRENTGPGRQVFVRDIAAGRTERISVGVGGAPADGEAYGPSISATGQWVAFESPATNLAAGDVNGFSDVFRRDRRSGATDLVSVTADGGPAKGPSGEASISRDGRMVAFTSTAADLVGLVPGGVRLAAVATIQSEVYLRDLDAQATILASVGTGGQPGGGHSFAPAVAGNGRFVAFASDAPTLVRADDNGVLDVFIRDFPPVPVLNPGTVDLGSHAVGSPPTPGAAVLANAGWGPLSVTGATVAGSPTSEFKVSFDGCAKRVLHQGEACTVTVVFSPAKAGTRTATLRVADAFTGSPRTARLRGNGSQAVIKLDPPVGPPGTVVVVTGTGFPHSTKVRLAWSEGITPKLPLVDTDADGRFRIGVLVFHNDRIGTRNLTVVPAGAETFPTASAPMLVTDASAMPPGFTALYRFVDLPLVLVIRG